MLQLEAFSLVLQQIAKAGKPLTDLQLVLIGGCRNEVDEALVRSLRLQAEHLGIQGKVTFHINANYSLLESHLATAFIGLHTMRDEHFGIGIVEYMVRICDSVSSP